MNGEANGIFFYRNRLKFFKTVPIEKVTDEPEDVPGGEDAKGCMARGRFSLVFFDGRMPKNLIE
ncbi:MAG TPA: hypothetical protein DEB31_08470 [Clostridiales bacterium]|nr:hypothetical protein [Clostridiales bacterium]